MPSSLLWSPLFLYLLASLASLLGRVALSVTLCRCYSSIWLQEKCIVDKLKLKGLSANVCVCVVLLSLHMPGPALSMFAILSVSIHCLDPIFQLLGQNLQCDSNVEAQNRRRFPPHLPAAESSQRNLCTAPKYSSMR